MNNQKKTHSLNILLSPDDFARLQRCATRQICSMAEVLRQQIRRLDGMTFDGTNCCANGQLCMVAHLQTPAPLKPVEPLPDTPTDPNQQHLQLPQTKQENKQPCTQAASS